MKLKPKYKLFFVFLALFVGVAALLLYAGRKTSEIAEKRDKRIVTTYKSTIKNNPYSLHVSTGKTLTGKPYRNTEDIEQAYRKKKLVKVENGTGYIVSNLTHSKPFLQKDAADVLSAIGKEFSKASNGDRFIVNSLTRPIQDQKVLTKTNPVASPNTSSHSYGVSFDIAYTKFNSNKKYSHDAHKAIEEVLKKFQKEKRIYVIREKQSACYHVTVRK